MEHCAQKHRHSQLLRYLSFVYLRWSVGHGTRAVIHSTMNTTNYEIKGVRFAITPNNYNRTPTPSACALNPTDLPEEQGGSDKRRGRKRHMTVDCL